MSSLGSSWISEKPGVVHRRFAIPCMWPVFHPEAVGWMGRDSLLQSGGKMDPHTLWIWPGWNEMAMKMVVVVTGHT